MLNILDIISGCSDEKAVLTRLAKAMDSVVNGTEFEGMVLSEVMSQKETQDLKDYVGNLIMPYIVDEIKHCMHLGQVNNMEEDVLQNLALLVYSKFPTYNNSKTKEYGEIYDFSTFIKIYVKDAVRKTRAQERGYKSRLNRKRRKIAKARAKAAELLNIKEEDVAVEDIYAYMPLVTDNPLSFHEIKRTMNEYLIDYLFDDTGNAKDKGIEDEILLAEDNIVEDFKAFIDNLRPMQKYIFLQSYGFCSNKHEKMKSNVIGLDPVLVMLGREDENGQAHITEEQLEARYIRKEKERLTNKMRKLVEKMDYTETEIRANLMPLLNELQEEMREKYDL